MERGFLFAAVFAALFALPFASAYDYSQYWNGGSATGYATATGSASASGTAAVSGTATASSGGVSASTDIKLTVTPGTGDTAAYGYATIGSAFTIRKYSNPSTGYSWKVTVDDESIVKYVGMAPDTDCNANTVDSSTGIVATKVGAGCNQVFTFKAVGVGSTKIRMVYARPWDANSTVESKEITVNVYAPTTATAIPTATPAYCKEGEIASKHCCATDTLCRKICKNGQYTEDKVSYPGCNATPVTPVPAPTATPSQTFEVGMQKGWNLFSVPAQYGYLQKTTCSRDRTYYYNTAAGKYDTASVKSAYGTRAYWFYSDGDCTIAYAASTALKSGDFKAKLYAGWNMVGAPIDSANYGLSSFAGNCTITAAYSFDTAANSWAKAGSLEADKGYFIKVSDACVMYGPDDTASIPALPE